MSKDLTNKEMLMRTLDEIKEIRDLVIQQTEHSRNVDNHLGQLNSKVATNVSEIEKLKTFRTKVVTYATVFAGGASLVVNKYFGL